MFAVHGSNENENEFPYELETELISCTFNVEDDKLDEFPPSTKCVQASDKSFTSSENSKTSSNLNLEDELFGQQDSDLSFVTTWDPLLDFEKENSSELDSINSDSEEVNFAGEFPTGSKKTQNVRESATRNTSPLIFDSKSPEFVKNIVASNCGQYWKWK